MPGYFVTAVRDTARVCRLAGPFATHDEALVMVDPARKLACDLDGRFCFDAFGTSRWADDATPGVLNDRQPTTRIPARLTG